MTYESYIAGFKNVDFQFQDSSFLSLKGSQMSTTVSTTISDQNKLNRFVEICVEASNHGHSAAWIAARSGLTLKGVNQLRTKLRTAGVPLPQLNRGPVPQEIESNRLTKLIASSMGESLKSVQAKAQELRERNETREAAMA